MHVVIERAKLGDLGAADALVDSLKPRISKMAAYYARCSGEDPDDLLQEAWIGLLLALPNLDTDIGSPEQFLIKHAKWQILDALRRSQAQRSQSFADGEAELIPAPLTESAVADAFVSEFLRKLSDTQRRVLKYLLAGLTWREAGREMGCTSANIAYYVRQIRKQYEKWNSGL